MGLKVRPVGFPQKCDVCNGISNDCYSFEFDSKTLYLCDLDLDSLYCFLSKFLDKPTLNELAQLVHANAKSKGFYTDDDKHLSGGFPAQVMLIVTELSEAVEADRVNDFNNMTEELADAIIRLLDLTQHLGIDIEDEVTKKMKINSERPFRHNKKY